MEIRQHNYSEDKKGYVSFKNGIKKIKLRKYLDDVARKISQYNNLHKNENRKELIVQYNMSGLKGVQDSLIQVVMEAREKASKEVEDQIELIKKANEKK